MICVVTSGMPYACVEKIDNIAVKVKSSRSRVLRDLVELMTEQEILSILRRKEKADENQ